MWTIKAEGHFHAAHRLVGYEGVCSNVHGHTWRVIVHIDISKLNEIGIGIDFKGVKDILKEVLPDHKDLNEEYSFNPTAENISRHLFNELKYRCVNQRAEIRAIELYETDKNSVIYRPSKV